MTPALQSGKRIISGLKRLIIGRPLSPEQLVHERLSKRVALALFSADVLAGVIFATEAILLVLIRGGMQALGYAMPIAIGVTALSLVIAFSYSQIIYAYPDDGGAYSVARANLGEYPGLVAAAALLIDYVLTVAVSISAGVWEISQIAATWGYPTWGDHRIEIALVCIAVIMVINLRGAKQSGAIFAVLIYISIGSIVGMILLGLVLLPSSGWVAAEPSPSEIPEPIGPLSVFLILRAFAAGCTGLIGVEAISNGVLAFKQPESKNAATTLIWMIATWGILLLGISILAYYFGTMPREDVIVVLQIAHKIFGTGPLFLIVQVATMLVLLLGANTIFVSFPRLTMLLAQRRFLPPQFARRGDRLVFSTGVILLGLLAMILVIGFNAREQKLLPLYAIGGFTAFTLAQAGMASYWLRRREGGWRLRAAMNLIGTCFTLIVWFMIVGNNLTYGSWAVVVFIPLVVLLLRTIHVHHDSAAVQHSDAILIMTVFVMVIVTFVLKDVWSMVILVPLLVLLIRSLSRPKDDLTDHSSESQQPSQQGTATHAEERPLPRRLHIFLCHASSDKGAVRDLYQRLRADGFDPWLDEENLLPGQDWQEEIPKAVRGADVVIVCLSPNSITRAGYVQKEIRYALDVADEQPEGTLFLIPLKLKECDVPERLRRWHWVKLFEERGYHRLVRALHVRAKTIEEIESSALSREAEGWSYGQLPDPHLSRPDDNAAVRRMLDQARRALHILEEQAAGFGKLHIPAHLQIELEDKRREVAELEARLRDQ